MCWLAGWLPTTAALTRGVSVDSASARVSHHNTALITSPPPGNTEPGDTSRWSPDRREVRGLEDWLEVVEVMYEWRPELGMSAVRVSWDSQRSGDLPAGLVWCGLGNKTNTQGAREPGTPLDLHHLTLPHLLIHIFFMTFDDTLLWVKESRSIINIRCSLKFFVSSCYFFLLFMFHCFMFLTLCQWRRGRWKGSPTSEWCEGEKGGERLRRKGGRERWGDGRGGHYTSLQPPIISGNW